MPKIRKMNLKEIMDKGPCEGYTEERVKKLLFSKKRYVDFEDVGKLKKVSYTDKCWLIEWMWAKTFKITSEWEDIPIFDDLTWKFGNDACYNKCKRENKCDYNDYGGSMPKKCNAKFLRYLLKVCRDYESGKLKG